MAAAASKCTYPTRFYLHYDTVDLATERTYWSHCRGESHFCTQAFVDYLHQHPCRTDKLTSMSSIVVANVIHRAIDNSQLEESFRHSLRVLRRLPPAIMNHRHVYLFAGGEMWLYAAYHEVVPHSSTFFSQEPLFWRVEPLARYAEPTVPQQDEACYIYAPSTSVVVVPYTGGTDKGFDLAMGKRPYQVAFYGAMHGRGVALRKRLYQLCDSASTGKKPWMCWREFLPGGQTPMFRRFQQSDFCFCPVGGACNFEHVSVIQPRVRIAHLAQQLPHTQPPLFSDGPLRTTVWQALRRGCIPVLFASCPQGALREAYDPYFVPKDNGIAFGVHKWYVLLNQTAAMLSDSYVYETLSGVTEAQLRTMRQGIRPYATRLSWFDNETTLKEAQADLDSKGAAVLSGDAMSFVLRRILTQRRGAPLQTQQRVPGHFVLDSMLAASADGRLCTSKACRHREKTGRRKNYSLEYGFEKSKPHSGLRRPLDGQPCVEKHCGHTKHMPVVHEAMSS